ncbi:MAG: MATE family efflux transporter [Candidatus Avilachnospira sp.]|jgi:putative MATE family efflux protein
MNENFMREKPVTGLIFSLSMPMVLSMLINSLYNIVDSLFVARISDEAMTALSLIYPVQNFINAVGIGFGVGISSVIAVNLGAGNKFRADEAASAGMALSFLHGILLTVCSIILMPAFLRSFTSDAEVISLGLKYSLIAFSFSVIISLSMALEKIFQAVGRMKITMAGLLLGCIANIILDPILIFGLGPFPKLGIEGAALATGLGQTLTFFIYSAAYFKLGIPVKIKRELMFSSSSIPGRLYSIGIPAILNIALPSVLIAALNGILAAFSSVYILILGIYYKLQTFLYMPANGLVQGMRPLIGFNYGAGEKKRVERIYDTVLLFSGVIMLIGTAICQFVPEALMSFFTGSPETIAEGAKALRIISAGFIISSVSVTSSGALEGIGKGFASLIISLCRYTVVILPAAFLLSSVSGPSGVWQAFLLTEAVTAPVSYVVYKKALRS